MKDVPGGGAGTVGPEGANLKGGGAPGKFEGDP